MPESFSPMPDPRVIEKIMKGCANHRRVRMLFLLEKQPFYAEHELARLMSIKPKNASEHLRRLMIAGLVQKRRYGQRMFHPISNLGRKILKFVRKLE